MSHVGSPSHCNAQSSLLRLQRVRQRTAMSPPSCRSEQTNRTRLCIQVQVFECSSTCPRRPTRTFEKDKKLAFVEQVQAGSQYFECSQAPEVLEPVRCMTATLDYRVEVSPVRSVGRLNPVFCSSKTPLRTHTCSAQ